MSWRNWFALLALGVGVVGLSLDFPVIAGTVEGKAANPLPRRRG